MNNPFFYTLLFLYLRLPSQDFPPLRLFIIPNTIRGAYRSDLAEPPLFTLLQPFHQHRHTYGCFLADVLKIVRKMRIIRIKCQARIDDILLSRRRSKTHQTGSRINGQRCTDNNQNISLSNKRNSHLKHRDSPNHTTYGRNCEPSAALSPIRKGTSNGSSVMQAGSSRSTEDVTFVISPCRCSTSVLPARSWRLSMFWVMIVTS